MTSSLQTPSRVDSSADAAQAVLGIARAAKVASRTLATATRTTKDAVLGRIREAVTKQLDKAIARAQRKALRKAAGQ